MDMRLTLAWLAAAVLVAAFANWRARRPHELGQLPLVPWNGVQFLALLAIIMLLAHVVSLATGTPLLPRGHAG